MTNPHIQQYLSDLNVQFCTHQATEHSYRPALKDLLQHLLPGMVVTNEPARFECGAPDYIITRQRSQLPVFFVEAKDLDDNDLDGRSKSRNKEQFDRYKQALDHILFTDYLDFHLYEHGEFVESVRIADIKGDHIVAIPEAEEKFVGLIQYLASASCQRITSASRLAKIMAGKARLLDHIIELAMTDTSESYANNNLHGQYSAFKDVLIQELKPEEFADIYAQTIVYGMFAARLHDETPEDFSREEAARLIPKTNPFLRQVFNSIAGNDLDDRIAWVVDDLVTVFQSTNIKKIMDSYVRNKRHHDPMIHFYEDFLSEYNPKLRKSKGVWYTPQPVVGFIVRAVDEILQKDFGLPEGLADYSMTERRVAVEQSSDKRTTDGMKHTKQRFHRVQILDPATGTGTFLAEVVNQIYDRYRDQQGIWQQYVEQHLLPRLHGFEILMASYAVAHLKLDMLLGETGYQHLSDKRLQIYLTNSLEESNNEQRTLFAQWLSREASEANLIKRDYPVMVMIGNPPYSVSSKNNGKWITSLIADYKKNLNERNIQPLSDDYIKFIRLGQEYVEKNGEGILAFICNNSFVDGIIHRQMRKELMRVFDKIYILNLHGNSRKEEIAPNGDKDENVFDIMQGVSINIFCKLPINSSSDSKIYHYDLFGSRESKYKFLDGHTLSEVEWTKLNPQKPKLFFVPKDFALQKEYEKFFPIDELMSIKTIGVATYDDKNLVSYEQFNTPFNQPYFYRPFDMRWINYDLQKVSRHRYDVMRHFVGKENLGLISIRNNRDNFDTYFVTNGLTDKTVISPKDNASVYPLYLYKDTLEGEERIPNFNPEILQQIEQTLGEQVDPQELFDYIYAILYSPRYRERYKEFLKIDFPRIPYPIDATRYHQLAEKGATLRKLHLMQDLPANTGITFPVPGSMLVDTPHWENNRVYINSDQYFDGVPESAWIFYIGGYQPAQKWLKDRKSRTLTLEEVKHYYKIIYILHQTEYEMTEIDNRIRFKRNYEHPF